MVYVITEDRNSARDFWSIAASIYCKGNFKVVPLLNNNGGNTTLEQQVNSIIKYMKTRDKLFIAFDNISSSSFSVINFLRNTKLLCNRYGIKFAYSKYYCFEEVYLSYDEMVNIVSDKYKKLITYINYCINNKIEYYDICNMHKSVIDFNKAHNNAIKNKEHFCNELLSEITHTIHGHFQISKKQGVFSKQGVCWLHSCNNIQSKMNSNKINGLCNNKCKYACKNKNIAYKLNHLNNNSLFRNWK